MVPSLISQISHQFGDYALHMILEVRQSLMPSAFTVLLLFYNERPILKREWRTTQTLSDVVDNALQLTAGLKDYITLSRT